MDSGTSECWKKKNTEQSVSCSQKELLCGSCDEFTIRDFYVQFSCTFTECFLIFFCVACSDGEIIVCKF